MSEDALTRHSRLAAQYGVQETNPVGDIYAVLDEVDGSAGTYPLSDRNVVKIEHLRLIGCSREYPWWDVSYCFGRLADGRLVRVDIGENQIDVNWQTHLIKLCKQAKRYGKDLGILDAVSTLRG